METRGRFTREEIFSQPEAWLDGISLLKEAINKIQEFFHRNDIAQVLFTGCGSTYYLSLAASVLYEEMTGHQARGIPASELWLSSMTSLDNSKENLLVAVSRSGETTETIHACEDFISHKRGGVITVVCYADSTLTKLGDINLIFPSGMEKSIAQTRAFSTLFLGVTGLCAISSNHLEKLGQYNALSSAGRYILNSYSSMAEFYGKNLAIDRIYFLGSGSHYGLACELSLKMKEMSLTHSEAFHFLEFRHGPKAMVNKNSLIVGLVSEINSKHEFAVLKECKDLGAEIISIGEKDTDVSFNSGLEEVMGNILYLPFGQMVAYERSMAKGLDPDHPNNLDSVVKLSQ
jgi:glucosamine--fructose-6-phosphate aminotransferase (isomerizing)